MSKLPIVERLEELRYAVPYNSYPPQKPRPCDVTQEAATTITELVSALKDARNALRHSIPVFPELEKRIDALLSNTRGDTK